MAPSRRDFLKFSTLSAGSFGLGLFISGRNVFGAAGGASANSVAAEPSTLPLNPIQVENSKQGTTSWQLTNPATLGEIEGYASLTSVNRGGAISLFVNTAEPSYTIEIFRMGWYGGLGARRMTSALSQTGARQPSPLKDPTTGLIECRWTGPFVLDIPFNPSDPTEWASGVYVAKLTAGISGKQRYIIFIVRDDVRGADYLFQSSASTFQAYNNWGGKSLYEPAAQVAYKVSFNRPHIEGYGAGHFFSTSFTKMVEARGWEYNMVRWLEREGYDVSYCTNLDTHADPNLLLTHKAFLSVGHDEYWSWQMRANVEAARDQGTSLAFFSANTCYWQVRLEPDSNGVPNRTLVCYKNNYPANDPYYLDADPSNDQFVTTLWRNAPLNRPEDSLLGVRFSNYGNDAPLVVENAAHWVYAGTGLRDGDKLPGLVGFETDRMFNNPPAGITRLARSPFDVAVYGPDYSDMTVYTAASGATVFAAGTILWSYGLDDYNAPTLPGTSISRINPAAQQMTRNVLTRLAQRQAPKPRYTISGHVTDGLNNNAGGVSVALTGTQTLTTKTDANGNYWFVGLADGSYIVTPSRPDLMFGPTNISFNNISGNQAANFTAAFASSGPILLTEGAPTRAVALDAATWMREPFKVTSSVSWASDRRTRIMFFAANLSLQNGEEPSAISCEADDGIRTYPMTVESVLSVPTFEWMTALVVRLSDSLSDNIGDVLIRIVYHGVSSNRVRVGIGHLGGGPAGPAPASQ